MFVSNSLEIVNFEPSFYVGNNEDSKKQWQLLPSRINNAHVLLNTWNMISKYIFDIVKY